MSSQSDERRASPHIGDLAELYALGVLEPEEQADVEVHVAGCTACARDLGTAEMTVAALHDAVVPQLEPPERLGLRIATSARADVPRQVGRERRGAFTLTGFYATAAALLLAAGISGGAFVERTAQARHVAHDSAVLATIATSHFNHVTLTAHAPAAPVSKVLYARDGSWLYVVIDSATCDCSVVVRSSAGTRNLGKAEVRGNTASLFAQDVARPTSLQLVDASGHAISGATLVYAAR